ncbi:Ig-like domain-containing protein [Yersinia bercovieri]|uniref:Ig-like domain-containing protein n=1 Tax=Yersinia bercovieri TaxID=634 RepID=UPI0011AB3973|nr:Ig-like domain-containing protein [Yersinia bercovieri]
MGSIFKGIRHYLCFGFLKKVIVYSQIVLQTLLGTLPLYSMSFSAQAKSDITKKTVLFKRLHSLTPTDTLESVASSYGLSVDELWALNINLYNSRSAFDAIKYGAVVYVPNLEEEQQATKQATVVASHLSQIGSSLSSESRVEALSRLAKGLLLSSSAKSVEEWLGHIGKAQVKLQTDDKNDFSGSELDLFIPLYDQPEKLAFSQFGFRRIDQRNIMNIGVGLRHYWSDWMLGYNAFFDQQISGNAHRRLGFGGEFAGDYFKLSANSYYRLGGWKNSTRLEDYDERAAHGYDIRAEAYLPHYPQLGGKLMYEQYFGDEVALFGLNERQKNPSALTTGVSYTPFPLLSLGLDHTIGNGGKSKTGLNVAVNYEINTPWQKQIDPAAVQSARTLAGSRMDLVDRNNNIVLEYRKQQVVTLNLPEKVSGKEKEISPINYSFNARHGLDRIEWDAADVIKAGGIVSDLGNLAYHITFPPYIDGGNNAYVLAGRAVDKKGNYSVSNSTNIYVTGVNINRINSILSLTPATLPANAASRSVLRLKLKTDAGDAVSGAVGNITFDVRDVSGNVPRGRSFVQPVVVGEAQEIQTGVYEASITSGSLVGRFAITPTVRGVQLNPIILTQSADANTATIHGSGSITISNPTIAANATDKTQLEVLVTDALGHPVPGVEVTWVSDLNSPGLEHVTSITNEHGIAENNFSSTITGTANITVQVGTLPPVQAGAIEITADNSTVTVNASDFSVDKTSVVANGTNKALYKLKVTDKYGNVVPATTVEWLSNIGSFIRGSTTTTDANGETSIELVSTKAEVAKVTARVGGKSYQAGDVTFIADRSTAAITLLPTAKINAAANGSDFITLNAKIVDKNNNPISNEAIDWDAGVHTVVFDPVSGQTFTNDQGESQISITSIQMGTPTLTAKVAANNLLTNDVTQALTFHADTTTAGVHSWLAPLSSMSVVADGTTVKYKVLVKDGKGHSVPNSLVSWETDLGQFTSGQVTATSTTNSNGEAEIELSSTQAGAATVKASVNNSALNNTNAEFVANSLTAAITMSPVAKQAYIANGNDAATYTVTVLDANNNPVNNAGITWDVGNGHSVTFTPISGITGTDGKATVNVTSKKAGSTTVKATLTNKPSVSIDAANAITFNADGKTAQITQVIVDGATKATADGIDIIRYKAQVSDENGNPVSNMTLTWTTNISQFASTWSTTDSSGSSTATLSSTKAGNNVSVSAQLTSGDNAAAKIVNSSAEFTAASPVNTNSSLVLQPNLIIANGTQTSALKFTLRDAHNNPVSGLENEINVSQSSASHVSIGAITATAEKGVYQATISGIKESLVSVTAAVNNSNVSKTQQLTMLANGATAGLVSVIPSAMNADANGSDSITYTAQVADINGNQAVDNVSVGWYTDLGVLAAPMTKTNASGVAQVTLTSTQAGIANVTAVVSSTSQNTANPVTFAAGGVSIAHSSFNLSHSTRVADGVEKAVLTAVLNDAQGNPVANQAANISVSGAGITGLTMPARFTESNTGVYTAELVSTIAGTVTITPSVSGSALPAQSLIFIEDVSTAKIADVNVIGANTVTVGTDVTYQAVIKDSHDNLLGAGIPVYWSVNRDTFIRGAQPMSLTNSSGVAEIIISRDVQGNAEVTAAVGANNKQAATVMFTHGGLDITQSSINLLKGNIIANNLDIATIQVDLRDSKGNPLPNLASQITTSPQNGVDGLKIEVNPNPNSGYLVTIKGTKAKMHHIQVKVNNQNLGSAVNLSLRGDTTTAQLKDIHVTPATIKADNTEEAIYTVKVVDALDNPLENYGVTWSLTSGQGLYSPQTLSGKDGVARTALKVSVMGQYKMSAFANGMSLAAPDVTSIAGNFDPIRSDFVTDTTKIDASGNTKATLTATLRDRFGNLLKGQVVNLRDTNGLINKGITLTDNPMQDHGDGTYSTEVTSTSKGDTKFIASINGIDLIQQPQLLVGNIIPQLSFDNKTVTKVYTKTRQLKQPLKGLPTNVTALWSSDNTDVAKIDPSSGDIELLKAGIVNISVQTVAGDIYAAGGASYQLEVERADPQLNVNGTMSDEWGKTLPFATITPGNLDVDMKKLTLNYQSNNDTVAKVANGNRGIELVKPGMATITVKSAENDRFKAGTTTYVLHVEKQTIPINFAKDTIKSRFDRSFSVQSLGKTLPAGSKVKWGSSETSVVDVAENGTVRSKSAGRTQITLMVEESDLYKPSSGHYYHEVYGTPKVAIQSLTMKNNGKKVTDALEWTPVFVDDVISVKLSNDRSQYERGTSAVVSMMEGNNELGKITVDMRGAIPDEAIFSPKASWLNKTLTFKVVYTGYDSLTGNVVSKNVPVKNDYQPIDIWKKAQFTRSYILFESNRQQTPNCSISKWDWDYAELHWELDIESDRELLYPMTIIEAYSRVDGSGNHMGYIEQQNSAQHILINKDTSWSKINRLSTQCTKGEHGKIWSHVMIKYLGKDYDYVSDKYLYWEGGGYNRGAEQRVDLRKR